MNIYSKSDNRGVKRRGGGEGYGGGWGGGAGGGGGAARGSARMDEPPVRRRTRGEEGSWTLSRARPSLSTSRSAATRRAAPSGPASRRSSRSWPPSSSS